MSFPIAHPEDLAKAAAITGLPPAAADEVSALATMQFSAHVATYQPVGEQAMTAHELPAATLGAGAGSSAATNITTPSQLADRKGQR